MKKLLQFLPLLFCYITFSQCPTGDVLLDSQASVNQFIIDYPTCNTISGNLEISGSVNDLSALNYIIDIQGDLSINNTNLITIANFDSLVNVDNSIYINNNNTLTSITGFNNVETVNQDFRIEYNDVLQLIDGFNAVTFIGVEYAIFANDALETISGFTQLESILGLFTIDSCPILSSIPDFVFLNSVGWTLQIVDTGLVDIPGFNGISNLGGLDVTGGLTIQNNANLISMSGFNNLETIEVDLLIRYNDALESISGFSALQNIRQYFNISDNSSLNTLNGLEALTTVGNGTPVQYVIFELFNNNMLNDCNAICQLLASNGILGLKNISDNLVGCNSELEIDTNCTTTDPPDCTTLLLPLDGEVDVPIDTDFMWNAVPNATGYRINLGTNSIFFGEFDAGNNLTFDLSFDLPSNTLIYVRLIPYNSYGELVCNNESFTTGSGPDILDCTTLNDPMNGAIDVSVNSDISWNPVTDATGYLISIGTTSGNTDIINALDVGNVTSYNPTNELPESTEIFISIIPYNVAGQASDCLEESFVTEAVQAIPDCTSLTMPLDGATDVSVSTDFSWNAVVDATGYNISIGTNSTLLDAVTLNNVLSYDLPFDLPENTEIFVEIFPFNSTGEAIGCVQEQFTTGSTSTVPDCTLLTAPLNLAENVSVSTSLTWSSVLYTEGYFISIGTTSGGTDIANTIDIGNNTTYTPTVNLPDNSQIFVTITPYNQEGQSSSCQEESFTTQEILELPHCTNLLIPLNGAQEVSIDVNLHWSAVLDATGYILNIGTSSNGTDIINNVDVGDVTNYDLPSSLPQDIQIYVTITPYNEVGQAQNCLEEQFSTTSNNYIIPRFFTPNNDNNNDIWIINDPEHQIKEVFIFNRYGKLLKELKGPQFFWDGYFNNQLLPVNDYWYLIKLNSGKKRLGHFTLKL